jgi:cytochrome c1
MSIPYSNYQYLMYPSQQVNANYPSLTQNDQPPPLPEPSDQEELAAIVQYIKQLKDPEKREEVRPSSLRPSTS